MLLLRWLILLHLIILVLGIANKRIDSAANLARGIDADDDDNDDDDIANEDDDCDNVTYKKQNHESIEADRTRLTRIRPSINPSALVTGALERTLFEMSIEDLNSEHRIDDHLVRRLIVLPLTVAFNPSQASAMHGKVQYGDKCSLPGSLGKIIFEKPYEVPWIFEVKPLPRKAHMLQQARRENPELPIQECEKPVFDGRSILRKAYISPLDFRSPENYIYLPQWLMQSLSLKSYDLVDVSFVRIKLAGLVVLQPQTLAWDTMMEKKDGNLKAVLEHEVNKYSGGWQTFCFVFRRFFFSIFLSFVFF